MKGGSRSDDWSPKMQRGTEMNADDSIDGAAAYPDPVLLLKKKGALVQTWPQPRWRWRQGRRVPPFCCCSAPIMTGSGMNIATADGINSGRWHQAHT
jgi:hypothetical protein